MPPFCEKHNTYHGNAYDCQAMTRRDERMEAEKARVKAAERIADDVIRDAVEQSLRPHATPVELMDGLAPGYGNALRNLLIDAVTAGMDAR